MKKFIPYGKHFIDNADIEGVKAVLKSNSLTQGPKILEFEKKISKYVKSKYAVAVSSCTAGLHVSLLACEMKQGKTVITTPLTFVSTANVVEHSRAKLQLVDIESDYFNLDINILKRKYIDKKKNFDAIMPVHFAGNAFDTKKLRKLVGKRKIIIEDAAHALGSKYKDGTMVGSCKYADVTVFSLHPVKTIACGEGGIITTNNKKIYKKLLRLRSHGINKLDDKFLKTKNAFTKGILNPWYYEMRELGLHYRMTDIQASLGITQLAKINKFLLKRVKISNYYTKIINKNKNKINFRSFLPENNLKSSNHLFIIKLDLKKISKSRAQIMAELRKQGIITQVHYIPVPLHPYYQKKFKIKNFPNTLKYYKDCLSIPIFYSLNKKQQKYVFNKLVEVIK